MVEGSRGAGIMEASKATGDDVTAGSKGGVGDTTKSSEIAGVDNKDGCVATEEGSEQA